MQSSPNYSIVPIYISEPEFSFASKWSYDFDSQSDAILGVSMAGDMAR